MTDQHGRRGNSSLDMVPAKINKYKVIIGDSKRFSCCDLVISFEGVEMYLRDVNLVNFNSNCPKNWLSPSL